MIYLDRIGDRMKSRIELNQEKQNEIIEEQKKLHQQKIVKRIVKGFVFCFFLVFFVCLYITKVGTVSLIVHEEVIQSNSLPDAFHGFKVIQFSDLHYENQALLDDVVKQINLRKPDMVLFTGDVVKNNKLSDKQKEQLTSTLNKIEAPIGKYAVLGETDQEKSISILQAAGFTILNNQYDLIYQEQNDPILLMGFNTNDKTHLVDTFSYYQQEGANQAIYSILMMHEPDSFDAIPSEHPVSLALAGHYHGGEVNLFGIGFAQKEGAKKYQKSFYSLGNTKFYISQGIGMSQYSYRFGARPSITFFRFMKTSS